MNDHTAVDRLCFVREDAQDISAQKRAGSLAQWFVKMDRDIKYTHRQNRFIIYQAGKRKNQETSEEKFSNDVVATIADFIECRVPVFMR